MEKKYRVIRDRILVRVVHYTESGIVRGVILAHGQGWPDERMPRFLFMNIHTDPKGYALDLMRRQMTGLIKDPVEVNEVVLFRIEHAEKIPSETGSLFVIREKDVIAIEVKDTPPGPPDIKP